MLLERDIIDLQDKVISFRDYFHSNPELSNQEKQTSAYIENHLIELGYEIRKSKRGHGLVALMRGREGKKTYGFRADMDALTVTEETNRHKKSQREGVMHACGHDGHMAILLGFSYYIHSIKERLLDNVLLIFQPAEEGPGGALPMIEEGLLDNPTPDAIFGFHVFPEVEEGKIALREGALMAQTGEFDIIIKGKSGHGAIPQSGIDSILIGSSLVTMLQSIVSRNIDPVQAGVVTIGKIYGGERRNIIAGSVVLEGTIRAFDEGVYANIKDRIKIISRGVELSYNCSIEVIFRDMYPPVVNDREYTEKIFNILGNDGEVIRPLMISEDFSYFQKKTSGVFMFLGSRNENKEFIYPLHNSKFDFSDEVLLYGLQGYKNILNGFGSID